MTLVARSDALVGAKANSIDAKTVLFMLSTVAVWFGYQRSARDHQGERDLPARAAGGAPRRAVRALQAGGAHAARAGAERVAARGCSHDVRFPASGRVIADGWTELFVTTTLTSLTGLAVGLCISASARTPDRAISFGRWR